MKAQRIGEAARRVGCTVETVRFYERRGLLAQPARKPSGYRLYAEEDIARLQFIRKAKKLGFTLKEIKELLTLRPDPVGACPDVQHWVETKIADIQARIRALQGMQKVLGKLVTSCKGRAKTSKCPVLEALEHWEED